jgi:hypothetical protein
VARILLLVKQSLVDVAIGRREHSAQVKHQIDLQVLLPLSPFMHWPAS